MDYVRMKPVAQIQTTGIYAQRNQNETTAVVSRNNILVVEDQNKLQRAIDQGNQKVIITAAVAAQMIAKEIYLQKKAKRGRNCAICCFIIALILAISFGAAFGSWKKNAENVQDSLFTLRDELQNDVFYTDDYDELKEICLSPDYSSCYDVGIRVSVENPTYNDNTAVILSLPKDTDDNDLCLTSSSYQCTIRLVSYSHSTADNCRASEYQINSQCQAVLTDSFDSCSYSESLSVANGGSYYTASDVCSTGDVADKLAAGTQASCSDCNVVIRLENAINYADNLF